MSEIKEESLRIVGLQVSNLKRVTAVSITPSGNIVTLAGPNESGKSSILDAVWYALGGKDAICEMPLRKGATKSETTVKLGGSKGGVQLIATRRITALGTTITVTDADGKAKSSPQTILDSLVGTLSFDPIEFGRMKKAERLETLRQITGLDFSAEDKKRADLYVERAGVNRELDSAKVRLRTIEHFPDAPAEKISIDDLLEELEAAEKSNATRQGVASEVITAEGQVRAKEEEVRRLEQQLVQAKEDAGWVTTNCTSLRQKLSKLVTVDVAPIKAKIAASADVNRKIKANEDRQLLSKSVTAIENRSKSLSNEIEKIDSAKKAKIGAAKFPIPELKFGDSDVMLNDVPFEQASTGVQIRACFAVGMALNPKLRVIFIRNGSLVDDAGLKLIAGLAAEHDFQVWIEMVKSDDPTAVLIEDGHVKTSTEESKNE